MNLVGKIFTVLVFAMSLVFMAFSIAVYATHRNYKAEILRTPEETIAGQQKGLRYQIQDLWSTDPAKPGRLQSLQVQKAQIEAELAKEKVARQQMVAMLEARLVDVKLRRDALITEEQKLERDIASVVTDMQKTQASIANLRATIDMLRTNIAAALDERNASLAKVVELEDKLAQAIGEYDRLYKRHEELTKDLGRYTTDTLPAAAAAQAPGARVAESNGR
jgi:chromosome segregation ATPase